MASGSCMWTQIDIVCVFTKIKGYVTTTVWLIDEFLKILGVYGTGKQVIYG